MIELLLGNAHAVVTKVANVEDVLDHEVEIKFANF